RHAPAHRRPRSSARKISRRYDKNWNVLRILAGLGFFCAAANDVPRHGTTLVQRYKMTNKDLVQKYVAALNARDLPAVEGMVSHDLRNHAAVPEAQGAAGMTRILEKLFHAMPDLRVSCEDLIAEGDRVVCRWVVRGTQTGPLTFVRLS